MRRFLAIGASLAVAAAGGATAVAFATSARTIRATVVPATPFTLSRGTRVSAATLGNRVFVSRTNGFALSTVRGVTYPACTTNGGFRWHTCGPALHVPAAAAPNVVEQPGAQKNEYFAYQGGMSVDVSTNMKTWYRAYFPGEPLAVSANSSGELFVFVVAGSQAPTEWTSTNGGRTWKEV